MKLAFAVYKKRPLGSRRQKLAYCLGVVIVVGAVAGYYRLSWPSCERFSHFIDPACMLPYCDFTSYYYEQARVIVHSNRPIAKYFYSPTFALLLTPLAQKSRNDALSVWTWVQGLSVLVLIIGSLLLLSRSPPWTHLLVLFLTITNYPILHNWKWGQANTTFMALTVLSLALQDRTPAAISALPLALATSSRYFYAIYACAFYGRRNLIILVWFCIGCAALLVVLPACVMGMHSAWHFYDNSATSIYRATIGWVSRSISSQYMPTVVTRLVPFRFLRGSASRTVLILLGYTIAFINVTEAIRAIRREYDQYRLWAFCFLAGSTPFLLPTSWMHYFVYLPLAQTFIAARIASTRSKLLLRWGAFVLGWLPCVILSNVFFFQTESGARAYAHHGYLLFSNVAMLGLLYTLKPRAPSIASKRL